MPRYVIQRDIPEVGSLEREALRGGGTEVERQCWRT